MKLKQPKSAYILHKLARLKEIRERRSDPSFKDFSRYLADCQFIVRSFRELAPKSRVLDIGAGAGIFSLLLKRLGFKVTATNFVSGIGRERTFFRKFGVDFVPLNLDDEPIPFRDDCFDAVLFMHVIEHLKTGDTCLSEIRRVLRHGGLLILMTPNLFATILPRFIRRLSPFLNRKSTDGHFKEYTLSELVSRLESLGFTIQRSEYSSDMVTGFLDIPKTAREALSLGYRLGCRLIQPLSYEIHIAACKKNGKQSDSDYRDRSHGLPSKTLRSTA